MHIPGRWVAALLFGLLLGCTTTKKVVPSIGSLPLPAPPTSVPGKVLVLAPKIEYQDMATESRTELRRPAQLQVRDDLTSVAASALQARGYSVVSVVPAGTLESDDQALATSLMERADQLLRAMPPAEDLERLKELGNRGVWQGVLVQHVRVKIGPGGYWDPNSGMIGAAMHNATLRASLLDPANGKSLWQNSVYLRDTPSVGSSAYRRALESLFPSSSAEPIKP